MCLPSKSCGTRVWASNIDLMSCVLEVARTQLEETTWSAGLAGEIPLCLTTPPLDSWEWYMWENLGATSERADELIGISLCLYILILIGSESAIRWVLKVWQFFRSILLSLSTVFVYRLKRCPTQGTRNPFNCSLIATSEYFLRERWVKHRTRMTHRWCVGASNLRIGFLWMV